MPRFLPIDMCPFPCQPAKISRLNSKLPQGCEFPHQGVLNRDEGNPIVVQEIFYFHSKNSTPLVGYSQKWSIFFMGDKVLSLRAIHSSAHLTQREKLSFLEGVLLDPLIFQEIYWITIPHDPVTPISYDLLGVNNVIIQLRALGQSLCPYKLVGKNPPKLAIMMLLHLP